MKNIYKFLIGFIVVTVSTNAQAQYNFSTFTAPYQSLSNPVDISVVEPEWDDEIFYAEIGFPVNAFGIFYDSIAIETNGTVLLYNTLTSNSIQATTGTFPALNGFGEFLSSLGSGDLLSLGFGLSPVNYELFGVTGSRIAKIEWDNAGFYNDPNAIDFINFQVWLYETSGDIEYRYGTSSVTPASYSLETGPTVGISLYESFPNYDFVSGMYLSGDSISPTTGTTYNRITGTPVNGTVYRFENIITKVAAITENQDVAIYPNPTTGIVNVAYAPSGISVITLSDMAGRVIYTEEVKANGAVNKRLGIDDLTSGIYFITIQDEVTKTSRKLVVK